MNIKPLADRVLILPAPAEEKTIGKRRRNGPESRRPSIIWQIFGHRNRTRRCKIPDYASKRCARRTQLIMNNEQLKTKNHGKRNTFQY